MNHKKKLQALYDAAAKLDMSERELRLGAGGYDQQTVQAEQFEVIYNILSAYGVELLMTDSLTANSFRIRVVKVEHLQALYFCPTLSKGLSQEEEAALGYLSKLLLQTADKYLNAGTITSGDAPGLFEFIASIRAQNEYTHWMADIPCLSRLYRLSGLILSGFLPAALTAHRAAEGLLRLTPSFAEERSAHLLGTIPFINFDLAIEVLGCLSILRANEAEKALTKQAAEECIAQLEGARLTHSGLEHVNSASVMSVDAIVNAFVQYL
jgi:hypothetical protein